MGNFEVTFEDSGNDSPTVSFHVFMMVLVIAYKRNMRVVTADVTGAYLNAGIRKPVYKRLNRDLVEVILQHKPELKAMTLDNGGMVVELKKALYGLREAARQWYDLLSKTLLSCNLVRNDYDTCNGKG